MCGYDQIAANALDWYLVDFLWAYALTFTLNAAASVLSLNPRGILILCFLTDFVVEWLQRIHVFRGTFDAADIVVQMIGATIAQVILRRCLRARG